MNQDEVTVLRQSLASNLQQKYAELANALNGLPFDKRDFGFQFSANLLDSAFFSFLRHIMTLPIVLPPKENNDENPDVA